MRILLVTPFDPRARTGNGVTAVRWARLLRQLKHRVTLATEYYGQPADCCIALHARRSAESIRRWRAERGDRPLVVGLAGTDLYVDLPGNADARRSLELADRLVLLQPAGLKRLERRDRAKADVILQSAEAVRPKPPRLKRGYEISVLSNLRRVKDPLRAALASRALPRDSQILITHVGPAREVALAERARAETDTNPRYRWRGPVTHSAARWLLARSRATVLSSRSEGGANVVAEAIVNLVPVLATRIDGTVGQLGRNYPAYFEVGDTAALTELMIRIEFDAKFRTRCIAALRALAPTFRPKAERDAWKQLLARF
jgi:putative glycosyltransferase (TIGR04348 family)